MGNGESMRLDTLDLGLTVALLDDITEFIASIPAELQPRMDRLDFSCR